MSKPYSTALQDLAQLVWELAEHDGVSVDTVIQSLVNRIKQEQAAIDRAYQAGFESAILHLEKEYRKP